MTSHRNPVIDRFPCGVRAAGPDKQRVDWSGGQHLAQVARLLEVTPVGELWAEQIDRLGTRGDLSLVRMQRARPLCASFAITTCA